MISRITFVARRAARNLRALFWTHALTSGTMAMTLFIFGALMLAEVNLQALLKGWGDNIHLNAYLDNGVPEDQAQDLMERIRALPEVLSVRYISRNDAWGDLSDALGSQSMVLEGLPRDILPASLEIAVKPAFRDAPAVERLAARIKDEKGVGLVEYPREWIHRLGSLVRGLAWVKWIFAGVMFAITFFIVSSAVQLAVLSRTDEIEIMQLVGASRPMIQAPFVLEGMIQGLVGGIVAVLALWGVFEAARSEFAYASKLWGISGEWRFIDHEGMLTLVVLGWLLGLTGSLFSVRKFVKKWRAS